MSVNDYLTRHLGKGDGRNNALFVAVMQAREDGWSELEIHQRLGQKAQSDGLTAAETRKTIDSAMRRPIDVKPKAEKKTYGWDSVIGRGHMPARKLPEFPQPGPRWETEDFPLFLRTLFKDDEHVAYNVDFKVEEGEKMRPSGYGKHRQTVAKLLQRHEGQKTADVVFSTDEAGAWIRLNPTDGEGIKDANITAYRHALVECDDVPIAEQWRTISRLNVPCATVVHSGSKSLHFAVKVDAPDKAEYNKRVSKLYEILKDNGLDIDTQNKNPSRLSRLPGVTRNGKPQYLLATNIGAASWQDWIDEMDVAADGLPPIMKGSDLHRNPPPLPDELIEGLLYQGHKMTLAGPSKFRKTWSLVHLFCSLSCGGMWYGYQCRKTPVLYLNLEVDYSTFWNKRVQVVADAVGADWDNLEIWNLRGFSAPLNIVAGHLIRRIKHGQFGAVIIDPIYKVLMGDENSAKDMADFCNELDRIAENLGTSVILATHFSKGSQTGKEAIDRASGSGVLARDPDAIGTMTPLECSKDEEERPLELEWTLREFKKPGKTYLAWEYPIHRIDPSLAERKAEGANGRPKSLFAPKLRQAILDNGNGATCAGIRAVAKTLKTTEKTVRNRAAQMGGFRIEKGVIYVEETK